MATERDQRALRRAIDSVKTCTVDGITVSWRSRDDLSRIESLMSSLDFWDHMLRSERVRNPEPMWIRAQQPTRRQQISGISFDEM